MNNNTDNGDVHPFQPNRRHHDDPRQQQPIMMPNAGVGNAFSSHEQPVFDMTTNGIGSNGGGFGAFPGPSASAPAPANATTASGKKKPKAKSPPPPRIVKKVKDNDILSGRGGLANKHPGNQMFRRIVNENKVLYQNCQKKTHKHFLAVSIIAAMERQGGRFLKRHGNDGWVRATRKEAFQKTSQALREQDGSTANSGGGSGSGGTVASTKHNSNNHRHQNNNHRNSSNQQ